MTDTPNEFRTALDAFPDPFEDQDGVLTVGDFQTHALTWMSKYALTLHRALKQAALAAPDAVDVEGLRKEYASAECGLASAAVAKVNSYRTGWNHCLDFLASRDLLRTADAGWQPIETAPKDGTEILAWREDCGILLIRWDAPENFLSEKECEALGDSASEYGWMVADFVHGDRLPDDEIPALWKLPEPPKAEVKK